jgi:hypothetical protein
VDVGGTSADTGGCPDPDCPACHRKQRLASGELAAEGLKLLSLLGAHAMDAYPDFVEALVGAGVPGRIVRLLRQRNPAPAENVVVQLACVLGNMCLWDRGAVVRAGAVGALVPWLKQPEQELARHNMAQVLCNVVVDAGAAREVVELGGVPPLLELLGCEQERVRLWAATTLWQLVQHGPCAAAVAAVDGCEARLAERLAGEGKREVWEMLSKCLMRLRA